MSIDLKFNTHGIKIYKGDNIDVLRSLEANSINLIYCDILYNSGKTFNDYNDNLGSPEEVMEWYRPRIEEMHRVLKNDGSIYIHCNWRLDSYMRILLDQIFGPKNFRNRIYRKYSEAIRGFVKNYDSQVDTILYYTKDRYNFTFNEIKDNTLRLIPLFENGYLKENSFEFKYKDFYFNPKEHNKLWLVTEDKLKELYDHGELILIDGLPYRKTYTVPIGNLWDEKEMLDPYSRTKTSESYDTPKPSSLLKRIIEISSNEGDVVADFFMGGGTTVIETLKAKRKGIFCDISEKACNITIDKINMYFKEKEK